MGRMLGTFADENELDRPDLNKCPDCKCYFAGDNCPLCGKPCPEEMRAGNRKPVKVKKSPNRNQSGRVSFVPWYHTWWFILLMLWFMPIVGIILLCTCPCRKWLKITIIAAIVLVPIVMSGIIGLLMMNDSPVDRSLTQEEYIASCVNIAPELYYRSSENYVDEYLTMKLTVIEKVYNEDVVCYVCVDPHNENYRILVCDYIIDEQQNFIKGDTIVIYGEGAGSQYYTVDDATEVSPCINVAYAKLVQE